MFLHLQSSYFRGSIIAEMGVYSLMCFPSSSYRLIVIFVFTADKGSQFLGI